MVTSSVSPIAMRAVIWTSAAVYGDGGTKKSSALKPSPTGVATEIRPDVALFGTVVEIEVAVAAVMVARVPLNLARLLCGVGSKFCPVIVTVAPATPMFGVKLVMIGPLVPTVNGTSLE